MVAVREMFSGNVPQLSRWAVVDNEVCLCGVDAIQVITGCTTGNNNLLVREKGNEAYYFGVNGSSEALQILLKESVWPGEDFWEIRERVNRGEAEKEECDRYRQMVAEASQKVLQLPEEEFCTFSTIEMIFPTKIPIL